MLYQKSGHEALLIAYNNLPKKASGLKARQTKLLKNAAGTEKGGTDVQTTLKFPVISKTKAKNNPETKIETAIVNYIINSVSPLSFVEDPGSKEFVNELLNRHPETKLMSKYRLKNLILER